MQNDSNVQPDGSNQFPAGFTVIRGPNDEPILVPTYLALSTKLALETDRTRAELRTNIATPGVCTPRKRRRFISLTYFIISRGSR